MPLASSSQIQTARLLIVLSNTKPQMITITKKVLAICGVTILRTFK